jgi:hypothetical protein
MNIVEFFQQSSGKWFSQRTNHSLTTEPSESGKSTIAVESIDKTDPEVLKLCEYYKLNPSLALCAVRVSWEHTTEWKGGKPSGSTVLVAFADSDQPNQGKLLRMSHDLAQTTLAGRYIIGADAALTLITEAETMYSEERLWFASPNLRLRTSLVKEADGSGIASFFSEIRMGVTKPAG